jgi:hypothetical protein
MMAALSVCLQDVEEISVFGSYAMVSRQAGVSRGHPFETGCLP